MSDKKLFAVFGKPVMHSRSPQIFNSLFNNFDLNADYLCISVDTEEEILRAARSLNLSGFNITSPFKQSIIKHLDDIDEHSRAIEAVNTVTVKNGKFLGYNTDFIGVIDSLKKHGIRFRNTRAAVLGAGGAARAAAYSLLKSGAKRVVLMNRTEEKAINAARKLGCEHTSIAKAKEVIRNSDLLISCIPSHQNKIKPDYLKEGLTVLDANYRAPHLLQAARAKGCRTIDGREWLIYQAFPAFFRFTGQVVPHKLYDKIKRSVFTEENQDKTNIALIGFMGSGKSTVGRLLAEKTARRFVDIDSEIKKSYGKTIPEIFKQKNAAVFRKIEKSMISKIIPSSRSTVFSLGGGSVLDKKSRSIIKENCYVIWLWISVPAALKRIDINSRPILDQKKPETSAKRILSSRMPYYAGISDIVIDTETSKPDNIYERIRYETD
jgi:shikimate dehydrogenase